MSIVTDILSGGVGGLGDAVSKVIGSFKLSPEVQAQIQAQIAEQQFELNKIQLTNEAAAVANQSANIQAEAKSNWYTAGARPTFMYVVEFILLWNYVFVPLWHKTPLDLPGDLLVLFGTCVCGYVGARTYEKSGGKS